MLYHFPTLLPDETLYSGWARYAEQSGHRKKEDVFGELFGRSSGIIRFTFEKRIDSFASNFPKEVPYTSEYLLQNHTLFPLYSFTLFKRQAMELKSAMKGDERLWRGAQQFIKPRSHLPNFARYCIECAKHDVETYGETYWHRAHQIPDINICADHKCWLENSKLDIHVDRLNLVSASKAADLSLSPRYLGHSIENIEYFQLMLANSAKYFLNRTLHNIYLEDAHERYKSILFENGFSSPKGRLYSDKFEKSIYSKYPSDLLLKLQEEIYGFRQIWQTTRIPAQRIAPPAIHFLTIIFLGLDAESFVEHKKPIGPFGAGPWPCKNPFCQHFEKPVIEAFQYEMSNEKLLGIFTCECEFSYKIEFCNSGDKETSNPVVYNFGSVWKEQTDKLYKDPILTAKEINKLLGFSNFDDCSYNKLIKLEEIRNSKRNKKRDKCKELLDKFPGLTRTSLFKADGRLYYWFIMHDKKWFDKNLPEAGRGNFSLRSQISNWERYDQNLCKKLRFAYNQEILSSKRPRRITKNCLLSRINMHYGSFRHNAKRGRLPKTVQFLKDVDESREQYSLRVLKFVIQYYVDRKAVPIKTKYMSWFRLKITEPEIERKIEEGYEIIRNKIVSSPQK